MRRISLPLLFALALSCRADKVTDETGERPSEPDTDAPLDPDADEDGFTESNDCDDSDPDVNPDATELCDEIDNDCDDEIDEDDAADATTWYLDADGDGYGDEGDALTQCETPTGYVAESKAGFDCDDTDADYHPGADESDCTDANDYNCDGSVAYEDSDADGWAACEDCDDADAAVHPVASEVCDEIDNDCDGDIDDEDDSLDSTTTTEWFLDSDDDGYGDEDESALMCAAPAGYVEESAEGFDCDDSDDDFYPGADESDCADTNDYNCDGSVAYEDADGDGWAACEECDDDDAEIHPEATEICNEVDDDCDGDIDDADSGVTETTTWYIDHDGDGYGSDDYTWSGCEAPSGYIADDTDCDDYDADVSPDGTEVCNEIDDDCDGLIDDDDPEVTSTTTWYIDYDEDGFGSDSFTMDTCEAPSGYISDATDCDDTDASVSPDATEICDEIDNDCDGDIDDADDDVSASTTWYADVDGDGFGDADSSSEHCEAGSGYTEDDTDCDDDSAAVYPGATELCDEIDNDCDGDIDEDDASDASTWYTDRDGDGYGDADTSTQACSAPTSLYTSDATDCDDFSADIYPGATEVCDDEDNDCDGDIDDDDSSLDSSTTTTWYADADSDGYGDADSSMTACEVPSGYTDDATDCDDDDAAVSPAVDEICDGLDNDCDDAIDDDDDDLTGGSTWYADADSDGYGDPDSSTVSCDERSGYVSDASDCDDDDAAVSPDATESCNDVDDDCDGDIDDDDSDVSDTSTWYQDADGDGYGDPDSTTRTCEAPSGYVSDASDCDDSDSSLALCTSCNEILDYGLSTGDGVYSIDPTESGVAIDVYCDMTLDDGGWTLLMKQASHSGYGSELSVSVWAGWSTEGELLNETDATLDDGNMVNAAYSDLSVQDLRLTASETWLDEASGAWQQTVNTTAYDALSDSSANLVGNLGSDETTSWSTQSFTDESETSTTTGYSLCWRAGPWFNQTSYEYTSGGIKWGWFFNNECSASTTDTAEGLGCCGNSSWYRESEWTLYLWGR